MARANLLNTNTVTFLELIGNGKTYRVPPYQRDYSWSEEHWEDLWSDVISMYRDREARHYMGALVVEAKSDRVFQIIDGQQRVATLSVLALAVLSRLRNLAAHGVEADANAERALQLRARFIGDKDPVALTESSKLFLNRTDDGFYQDYLVQLREPLNPRRLPTSNRLLWECFKYFQRQIERNAQLAESGRALSELLSESMARQLLFILITVEEDVNAYTVFETLNARGLELSATDLLKNYLFSLVRGEQDLEALGRRWHSLVTTVRQDKFPEFLRYHLLCEEPKIRQQRLFKLVREKVKGHQDVFGLMNSLERRAELFAAVADSDHDYWRDTPDALPHVKELQLFRVRQPMPALFAAWETWDRKEFVRLLKLLVAFSFRYTVIGGLNPNDLEPAYHQLAKGILDDSVKGASGAFGVLQALYPSDEKFARDFAEAVIETGGARQKQVRYVLCKLESDASGVARDWATDPGTIEHVLPENPSAEWDEVIPPERQAQVTYRLGNLTLLEKGLNRDVGNRSFDVKRVAYATSGYHLTKSIDLHAASQWDSAAIESRQERMAKRAVVLWRSDFQGV